MPLKIEDYALIGNLQTAALVGLDGSIDWLCLPRFDSGACFAALLGEAKHGRWLLAPSEAIRRTHRQYRDATLILETEFETSGGTARIIDFMPLSEKRSHIVRIVEGVAGEVEMGMELIIRFDYGSNVPWVRQSGNNLLAVAGPDTLELSTPISTRGEGLTTVAAFRVKAGDRIPFVLTYRTSHHPSQPAPAVEPALEATDREWRAWSARCAYDGPWREAVQRSLITLKALTYAPTGGIVAAPTTSLPERLGGVRNWDYRFCWLRDATFTLYSLLFAGYKEEAIAWRDWLVRAIAGSPRDMQILYGIAGERRLNELELPWLPGYEGAAPVRIGNAACLQFQLDVYGEIMDTLHLTRAVELHPEPHAWQVQQALLEFLESNWQQPDEGIWEVRGPKRHFTHSKVMAWVAFDRAIKAVEQHKLDGPVERWRHMRQAVHAEVCSAGFNAQRNAFVQHYGATGLDASLLMIPLVGFLPPGNPRVRGTLEAIQADLCVEGLVLRYSTAMGVDGLPPGEGVFLPCSFWLVDNLALMGRQAEAQALFERLLTLRNDVGLIAEEYEPYQKRQLGNFPQAMTHVALINSACNLARPGGPCEHRSGERCAIPAGKTVSA
jgi:GH15 family glucan-1,4-alpha-glucosidase